MIKNKTGQVVFEILEILMFFRNKAPKISQMNALFLNKSNRFIRDLLIKGRFEKCNCKCLDERSIIIVV